jgi:hypothetical protein
VAVEPYRERIEDFMRRYWYEGNRALLVLVVVLAVLVAILLVRRLRVLRVLVPAVIGGIVVVLINLLLPPMPLLHSDGPVVENGVAAIVACGEKRDLEAVMKYVPEPATGTWGTEPRGTCTVHYHHPPDRWQRANRHERANQEQKKLSPNLSGSGEMLPRCAFAITPPRKPI